MTKRRWRRSVLPIALALSWLIARQAAVGQPAAIPQPRARNGGTSPTVWMCPPPRESGKSLRELFERPDDWQQTRSLIDVLGYADHHLDRQFTDVQLRAWFAKLRQWNVKFSLEVGAVKPWAPTGQKAFDVQRRKWDRFRRLGAEIYAIAIDEPLCCARKEIHQSDDYAVRETADFVALVRKHYPRILIGDIEPYPYIPLADQVRWIDALENRLKQRGVRGLDFYRLDVNWVEFTVFGRGNWREVKKLQQECRSRRLPFGLIYWASDYPALLRLGLADDATWYTSVMRQGYDYAVVGGVPDQYVIQSWIDGPARCVPETSEFTFTRSVRDFCRRFVAPVRKPPPPAGPEDGEHAP